VNFAPQPRLDAALAAGACLLKTRVWGPAAEIEGRIGGSGWTSSTLRWGSTPVYDGAAVGSLDQRYYATGAGRFMTADPYKASAGASEPGSWNRYAYTRGEPVSSNDRFGLFEQSASEGSESLTACILNGQEVSMQLCDLISTTQTQTSTKADPTTYTNARWVNTKGKWDDAKKKLTNPSRQFKCNDQMKKLKIANSGHIQNIMSQAHVENGFDATGIMGEAVFGLNQTVQRYEYLNEPGEYNQTISSYFIQNVTTVTAVSQLGGNLGTGTTIYLNPLTADHDVEATLFHEALHLNGSLDIDIMAAFGLKAKTDINSAIKNLCF
jgi:RHS repeat-associated protein